MHSRSDGQRNTLLRKKKRAFPEIKTKRLLLRQFVKSDLQKVYEGLSHPDVIKHYGISYDSLEEAKAQLEWFTYLEKTKTGIWWAVCCRNTKQFYGAGGINNIDETNKKAELGYWLLPEYWSKGIMSESLPKIIDHAFNNLGLDMVEGVVETENEVCKKSIVRLGFFHDKSKDHTEFKNGKFVKLNVFVFQKSQA
jgi:[ribosomal protein S5]-alanine N-acetyltransferase